MTPERNEYITILRAKAQGMVDKHYVTASEFSMWDIIGLADMVSEQEAEIEALRAKLKLVQDVYERYKHCDDKEIFYIDIRELWYSIKQAAESEVKNDPT